MKKQPTFEMETNPIKLIILFVLHISIISILSVFLGPEFFLAASLPIVISFNTFPFKKTITGWKAYTFWWPMIKYQHPD